MEKTLQFSVADLIDKLSIEHLKVTMKNTSIDAVNDIEYDLNSLLSSIDFISLSRISIIFALINSKCWKLKDEMNINQPEEYNKKLELAHDLNNGLKNSLKNLLLEKFEGLAPSSRKTTFYDNAKWYAKILENMEI